MKFPKHPAHANTPRRPAVPSLHVPRRELHTLLAGRKTQHRLKITDPARPAIFPTGESVAVMAGGPAACRVVIGEQRQEYVGRITHRDALAEGHRTRAGFARAWIGRTSSWANRFPEPSDDEVLAHFERHYAAQLVWVIEFRLDRADSLPVFLTPAAEPGGSVYGYTTTAAHGMVDAGETPDRDVFADRGVTPMLKPTGDPAKDARRREEHLRRELDALTRRARREILASGRAGVDTTEELEALKRLIESISQRRRDAA